MTGLNHDVKFPKGAKKRDCMEGESRKKKKG